tara:strand:+ start:727 stop:1293 length:567 start_codon:yes stop_codon:yes gene_type:complete
MYTVIIEATCETQCKRHEHSHKANRIKGATPMTRHILIALDESDSARKTVPFAATHLDKTHDITLLNVVPDTAAACGLDSPSLTPYFERERNSFCRMEERRQAIMSETLEQAKADLVEAGFDEKKLRVLVKVQEKTIAGDIVHEAENGGYSMVVMGRKSSTGIKDFLMGSTVQKVLHSLAGTPLTIVS